MKLTARNLLLAGTALVAAASLTTQAHAAPQTLTGNGTWASAGTHGGTDTAGDASDAAAGDAVNLGAFSLTVTNDQSANDGGGLDSFSLGAVSGAGALLITGGNATDLAVSGTTINLGAGGVTIDNGGDDASVSAEFSGAAVIGGGLTVQNTEDGAFTTDVSLTTGALSMGGATAVTAGSTGAASAGLTVNGNASFASGVTVTGGSDDAGETASLTLNGATNSFGGGGIALAANSGGAVLTLGGTAAQTVSGAITGDGAIIVVSSGGATFNNAVEGDTLTIDKAGTDATASAIFKDDLTLTGGLRLGGAGAGANTATFDTSGGNIAATVGTIAGQAGETNTLFVTGGHMLTIDAGAADSGGYDIALLGSGTGLTIDGSDRTIAANVTTSVNGQGTFNIADGVDAAIEGDIGTKDFRLGTFSIGTGLFQEVGVTGNVYADTVAAGGSTLKFLGDGNEQTVSGDFTGGYINVGDGTTHSAAVFDGTVHAEYALVVGSGSSAYFNDDVAVDSDVLNSGTVGVSAGHTLTSYIIDDSSPGTFVVGVVSDGNANTYGQYVETNDKVDLSNDTVSFFVGGDKALLLVSDNKLDNVFSGNAPVDINGVQVTDNSYIYNFSLESDGNNADAYVHLNPEVGENQQVVSQLVNLVFGDLLFGDNPEINLMAARLLQASTKEEFLAVEKTSLEQYDGGVQAGMIGFSDLSSNIADGRLSALRVGGGDSGVATGDIAEGLHMWGQTIGARADQGERQGVDGYNSTTWGGAAGIDTDTALGDRSVLGVAFSYGNTDVKGDGPGDKKSEIDSYQLTLYGGMDLGNAFYLNGQAGYARNRVQTERHDIAGISGLDAQGDYDANVYSVQAELGRDYKYEGLTVTPHALAAWTHLDPDSYTETGAGGVSLHVDGDSLDTIEVGTGLDVGWLHRNANGSYIEPKLSAEYRYNFGDDQVENTTSFVGGGGAFRVQGAEQARSRFNVGGSLRYYTAGNWDFTASYNYDFRADYGAHSGMVRAGYKF
jgi:outer membrane autotransporter protein